MHVPSPRCHDEKEKRQAPAANEPTGAFRIAAHGLALFTIARRVDSFASRLKPAESTDRCVKRALPGSASRMQQASLFDAARECLEATSPADKRALTHRHAGDVLMRGLVLDDAEVSVVAVDEPGRPSRPNLVDPRDLPRRGLGSHEGRAALLHAVAHIEFNAINLAWDAVLRFRGMPEDYYRDWVRIADDEARHFGMLVERLATLGFAYGDFDAHDGLWDMARRTRHSCLERMALVPRVLEARGLDVTPGMIARLRNAGDAVSGALLEQILDEEVAHVAAGSRWFAWCCAQSGVDPASTFTHLIDTHLPGKVRGPFNVAARLRAGFSIGEMATIEAAAA
jgi:uncharacterized ferritin-like protein (DUF455 family)